MRILEIIWEGFRDFLRDGGLMLAGSMSYFMMMALVPFSLFILTLIGYFLGHYPDLFVFFVNRIVSLFPAATEEITQEIFKLISFQGLGKFSLLLYGVLSFQVLASLEHSLNVIFKVRRKRKLIFSVLISLAVVTLLIALLVTSFLAASVIPLLMVVKTYIPSLRIGLLTGFLIAFVLPFVLVLFAVTTVYVLFPKTRVAFADALKGAVFTAVFLEIAKHVFTWYVGSVAQFGKIYGPLTAFVIFLLWMFYSSSIFLVGAEIVHNLGKEKRA